MQGGCAGGRGGGEVNLPAARGPCRSPRRRDGGWVGTARPEGLGARVTPAVAHARSSLARQGSSLWTSPTAPPHPAWTPGSPAELRAFWGPDGALRGGRGVSEGCGEDSQVHGRRPPAPARRSPSLKPLQPLPPRPVGQPGAPPWWPPSTFLTPGETPPGPLLRPSGPPRTSHHPREPGWAAAVSIPLTSLGGAVAGAPTEAPLSTPPKRQGQSKTKIKSRAINGGGQDSGWCRQGDGWWLRVLLVLRSPPPCYVGWGVRLIWC